MKTINLRKFILVLPGVAALALSPVYAGEQLSGKWHKPNWKQMTGKGYQMCDALLREMKSYERQLRVPFVGGESLCARELIIPHSRLFREPLWKKLDPEQYRPLLRKKFVGDFYVPEDGKKSLTSEQKADIERRIDKFIAGGGYLRTWTMPFPEWMESEARRYNMPITPLIYIQIVRPIVGEEIHFISERCRGISLPLPKTTVGGVVLVNTKLDGPDPRLMRYSFSSPKYRFTPSFSFTLELTVGSHIYLYKNIPFFFSATGVDIFSMRKKEWTSQNAHCAIY
ncbi:hypothetical protein JGC56_08050 [Salmonella enterica subsp. enterica serovar Saintpaul]|nr:hypothetical protein [Salmonella enterica subsp. enterica serovar Saintpaul]